ncbi:pentatricopeptide repeat-containing protein mitochondrial-like, partial [Trifolium medium]|nr:pentatricopeptide repeat-containing protein mitochondrial-like [Trifolium medium]
MCDLLVAGYCIDGKIEEARRLAEEMYRGGFELGVRAYNAMLDCICKICRQKDPFKLHSEIDHALKVFAMMKADGCEPGVKTYDLLMMKLGAHNRVDKANALFNEALGRGLPVTPKEYVVDPRFVKKKAVKAEKKRETLP